MNGKEAQKEFDIEAGQVDNSFIAACIATVSGMLVLLSVQNTASNIVVWLHAMALLCFIIALGSGFWHKYRKAKRKLHASGEKEKIIEEFAGVLAKTKEISASQSRTQFLALLTLHPELKNSSQDELRKTFDSHFPLEADAAMNEYTQLTAEKWANKMIEAHQRAYHLPMPERWSMFKMRLDIIAAKSRFWIFVVGLMLVLASLIVGNVSTETSPPQPVAYGLLTK